MADELYKELETSRSADADEIRKNYLRLSRTWHPDRQPPEKKDMATEKFQKIGRAYEILSDEKKRSFYDQTGQIPGEGGEPPGGGGGPFGMSMGGGMPFPFPMNDLFGMFGGRGGPGGHGGPRSGRNPGKAPARKTQINLTLKDFYFGRSLQMRLDRKRFCGGCNGEGSTNQRGCGDCGGQGVKISMMQMGPMIVQNQGPCMSCRGSGKTKGDSCKKCSGSKLIKEDKVLSLSVKPGSKVGETIIFQGESSHEEDYAEPGDVVIELVQADEDHSWERSGDNLTHRVTLSLGEALCGKRIKLDDHPGFEGGLFIDIPSSVQNRQDIIVEGCGMPRAIGTGYGDVILHITVTPNSQERESLVQNKEVLQKLFNVSVDDLSQSEGADVKQAKSLKY
jgi:DnaJ-class molecular chaperone